MLKGVDQLSSGENSEVTGHSHRLSSAVGLSRPLCAIESNKTKGRTTQYHLVSTSVQRLLRAPIATLGRIILRPVKAETK